MTVIARPHTRIGALEKVIEARRGIEIADQKLFFDGLRLNPFFIFAEIEFAPNDTIDCFRPQMGAGPSFVDVSDSSNLEVIRFSATAPEWRMATSGLNVEGVCTNSSCEAYQQMVIARIGMASWSLLEDPAGCPMCKQHIHPMTCAFSECQWIYDGCKLDENGLVQDVFGDWQGVDRQYHRFQEQGSKAEWQMLVLSARESPRWKSGTGVDFCSVCHQVPLRQKERITAACGHCFHTTCLAQWKQAQLSSD